MKVIELINKLSQYDGNREVEILAAYDGGWCYTGGKHFSVLEHKDDIQLRWEWYDDDFDDETDI